MPVPADQAQFEASNPEAFAKSMIGNPGAVPRCNSNGNLNDLINGCSNDFTMAVGKKNIIRDTGGLRCYIAVDTATGAVSAVPLDGQVW